MGEYHTTFLHKQRDEQDVTQGERNTNETAHRANIALGPDTIDITQL